MTRQEGFLRRQLIRDGWTEVNGSRTVRALHAAGFPLRFVQVHAFESQAFTRPWVMRLYVPAAAGGKTPLEVVGAAIREGLEPEACEAADRLGGVDAVVALAQGFRT